ncbi:hypothetical protein [Paenibacillus crassostreae]|uniref:DUF4129 domain-containing protein n=1 Tax=Paenibacillus crassostreae TaxID=1763538 RepID=A0A167GTU3_9BACL|nr:hypothetical protein [Paenibacillus crassostreae]AOZ92091.1 hypothetical protein LPB68_07565 [Paenibacillus crassostreae]OAB77900.1 hypothetical protein PNBC_00645 [Paenibacillus crassostreae]
MSMRSMLGNLGRISMTLLLEMLAFYAVILIISQVILDQSSLNIVGLMWIGGILGIAISLLLMKSRRWVRWFCILLTGVVILMISGNGNTSISGWIIWLLVMIASFRGSRLSTRNWRIAFPLQYQLIGIGCTLVLSMFSSKLNPAAIEAGVLYMAGVISLCSWLLRINAVQVGKETLNHSIQQGPLRGFARVNRKWSIITLAFILVFGAFTQLSQGFYWLWNHFTDWLNSILSRPTEPTNDNISTQPDIMPDLFLMDGDPVKETGPSIWMNMMYWIVGVIFALFVIYALYKLLRLIALKLEALFAKFGERVGSYQTQVSDNISFMDKVEKIENKRRLRPLWRKKSSPPEDIYGQVRYYYKSMVKNAIQQGFAYSNSYTPNEVADMIETSKGKGVITNTSTVQEMTSLYNDVRYGNKRIDERRIQHTIEGWIKSK